MKQGWWVSAAALAFAASLSGAVLAQDTAKVGLILPMTGPFASTGRQIDGAVRLYVQQHGSTVAGKKLEIILKDDAGVADNTRRIAQELVVNDKVAFLAGFGLTPLALATAFRFPSCVTRRATSAWRSPTSWRSPTRTSSSSAD